MLKKKRKKVASTLRVQRLKTNTALDGVVLDLLHMLGVLGVIDVLDMLVVDVW